MAARVKNYGELLRDPRWQRKRLEVMQRADFKCEECGDGTTTLNIHHTYYETFAAPWDYPSESLRCWCENCHQKWHEGEALRSDDYPISQLEFQRTIGLLGGNAVAQRLTRYKADPMPFREWEKLLERAVSDAFDVPY